MVDKQVARYQAYLQLAAKLRFGIFLAPYNGPYMRLVEVDDAVLYAPGMLPVQLRLLLVHGVQHQQVFLLLGT